MAKAKQKAARVQHSIPVADTSGARSQQEQREANAKWWREAIESIVVAIVLALLFRTFEAEAFVIPTGSMAPTLQGRHKDVTCEKCGYAYRSGASQENERFKGPVQATTCPMCRYVMILDWPHDHNHNSFTGDRILVNKFAYQFGEPKRWDVIVFKFPGNAKQNYIKRLVGLPGETVRIERGDVYIKPEGSDTFSIARKPPHKLTEMLQLVHDTDYIPQPLIDAGFPARWHTPQGTSQGNGWTTSEDQRTYRLAASSEATWLRYRHIIPTRQDWEAIDSGRRPSGIEGRRGELINDFYAYNACIYQREAEYPRDRHDVQDVNTRLSGQHWVGDLALECQVEVLGEGGELLLDLVEAGRHHQCRLDLASGLATLTIDEGRVPFAHGDGGQPLAALAQQTVMRGPGTYDVRFANVDHQLLLWINDRLVHFDVPEGEPPGAYRPPAYDRPRWSAADPGDLWPAGIGGRGVALEVKRLRLWRDVYYIATREPGAMEPAVDYEAPGDADRSGDWITGEGMLADIRRVFTEPETWEGTRLFDWRRRVEFYLGKDEFFPMGDNSPQSKDARLWHSPGPPRVEPSVRRELLTGKAFLIYWPHPWYAGTRQLPVIPNVPRMGLIR